LLVVSLTSLALRCRLGEEESIPLLLAEPTPGAECLVTGRKQTLNA
jgi:hypothetical protein